MRFRATLGYLAAVTLMLPALPAAAQSFRVQCPQTTALHPTPQTFDANGMPVPDPTNPGFIKCQHIAGGDGYATMADGQQIYLFGFGGLSGLASLQNQGGVNNLINDPFVGTQLAAEFNKPYAGPIVASGTSTASPTGGSADAAITEPAMMMNMGVMSANAPAPLIAVDEDDELFLTLSNVGMIMRPDLFEQHTVHWHGYPNASSFFDGVPDASVAINIAGSFTYYYTAPDAGTYFWHCHITPPEHLQMGMVGQLFVRPRQNRVPAGSLLSAALLNTYKAVGSSSAYSLEGSIGAPALVAGQTYDPCTVDPLCSTPIPSAATTNATSATAAAGVKYAYDDGDGSTRYDVEYPIQMMGFDPNFHFIGMTFNPEPFADMKDKYFLLNGRGYPDTINPATITTAGSDGVSRPSQPIPALIQIPTHGRALLRLSDLSVTEYSTLATVGIPMTVIAIHARMLRDLAGNNMAYQTNSITMGGGESMDVILDTCTTRIRDTGDNCVDGNGNPAAYIPSGTYFLYTTNLDHLSNDAENFGGMMTEIVVQ
ncbi:MAG: multicopper oxidase domain-containing protein [Proteobacteria bacterium]|nr:multicopper oxidase domain-containing protein [Pseudomonadota bacterium]